jgi:hypothetical protein
MEQRPVIRFLALHGLNAKAIQAELESVYGTDACKLSTVKKWRLRFLQGRTTLFDDPRSGRTLTNDLAEAVRSMLAEEPFTPCTVLCQDLRIAKAICLPILHDELAMLKFHLRWIPHPLSSNQRSARITDSSLLLEVLEDAQRPGFERIITGDESWFFLYSPHNSAWAASGDALPERVTQKIDTEKCQMSILWSVNGIHSHIDLPKGSLYNTAFFCDQVVEGVPPQVSHRAP